MPHDTRAALALTAVLAAVAGFVDAIGFLDTGGLFVSFMSGNSTQAAVDVSGPGAGVALASAGIVAAFVAGVGAGGVVAARAARPRPTVLWSATLAVAACAGLAVAGDATLWRAGVLAAAMGALNTLFLAEGRARVAVTYSTGTLVALGLSLADLVTGASRRAWRRPLLLWSALVGGAALGAITHRLGSPAALAVAALVLSGVAIAITVRERARRRPHGPAANAPH